MEAEIEGGEHQRPGGATEPETNGEDDGEEAVDEVYQGCRAASNVNDDCVFSHGAVGLGVAVIVDNEDVCAEEAGGPRGEEAGER